MTAILFLRVIIYFCIYFKYNLLLSTFTQVAFFGATSTSTWVDFFGATSTFTQVENKSTCYSSGFDSLKVVPLQSPILTTVVLLYPPSFSHPKSLVTLVKCHVIWFPRRQAVKQDAYRPASVTSTAFTTRLISFWPQLQWQPDTSRIRSGPPQLAASISSSESQVVARTQ